MRHAWLILPLVLAASGVAGAFERSDPLKVMPATAQRGPCSAEPAAGELTLAQVVAEALCRNPQTRLSAAAIAAQAAQTGVAKSAYLPTLDADLGYGRNFTGDDDFGSVSNRDDYNQASAGISLSYLVYDFGAREATLQQSRALLDAALSSHDRNIQTVTFNAVQSYYQTRAVDAALLAAQEAEKTSAASLDAARTRKDVGVATPADVLQAQTAHSQAVLTRIQAEGNRRVAQGQLANAMGLRADQPIRLSSAPPSGPEAVFEGNVSALMEQAMKQRPDLAATAAQQRAAESNVDAVRASGRPRVSLNATADTADTTGRDRDDGGRIGLNLTIPLFTGFNTTYRTKVAQAGVESAAAQHEQLRLQTTLDVWSAYQQLQTATQAVRSSEDLLASALQAQEVAFGRYQAGVGSVLDLLNAQSALAAARQQRVQAAFDLDVARVALALALGGLEPAASTPLSTTGNPSP
jgi:TolC family type I secretion outer membrane protein